MNFWRPLPSRASGRQVFPLSFVLLFLLAPVASHGSPVRAVVSVPPLRSVLEELGGPGVSVHVLFPLGQDVETTPARPRDLMLLERAHLVWWVGRPTFVAEARIVQSWLQRHPEVEQLSLAQVADLLPPPRVLPAPTGCPSYSEHPKHQDPHLWLSPRILQGSMELLETRLRRLLPAAEAEGLRERRRRLEERFAELDRRFRDLIQTKRQRALLVHHPAFGVLAQELGLVQCSLQDHGREPSGRRLRAISDWMAQESIGFLLVARGSRPSSVRVVARQSALEIVEYSVLESDWFAMMEELYRTLERVLR